MWFWGSMSPEMEEVLFSSGFTAHPFEQGFLNAKAGPEK